MAEIFKLLHQQFQIIINMLKALMENVDNMQEQMGNVSR